MKKGIRIFTYLLSILLVTGVDTYSMFRTAGYFSRSAASIPSSFLGQVRSIKGLSGSLCADVSQSAYAAAIEESLRLEREQRFVDADIQRSFFDVAACATKLGKRLEDLQTAQADQDRESYDTMMDTFGKDKPESLGVGFLQEQDNGRSIVVAKPSFIQRSSITGVLPFQFLPKITMQKMCAGILAKLIRPVSMVPEMPQVHITSVAQSIEKLLKDLSVNKIMPSGQALLLLPPKVESSTVFIPPMPNLDEVAAVKSSYDNLAKKMNIEHETALQEKLDRAKKITEQEIKRLQDIQSSEEQQLASQAVAIDIQSREKFDQYYATYKTWAEELERVQKLAHESKKHAERIQETQRLQNIIDEQEERLAQAREAFADLERLDDSQKSKYDLLLEGMAKAQAAMPDQLTKPVVERDHSAVQNMVPDLNRELQDALARQQQAADKRLEEELSKIRIEQKAAMAGLQSDAADTMKNLKTDAAKVVATLKKTSKRLKGLQAAKGNADHVSFETMKTATGIKTLEDRFVDDRFKGQAAAIAGLETKLLIVDERFDREQRLDALQRQSNDGQRVVSTHTPQVIVTNVPPVTPQAVSSKDDGVIEVGPRLSTKEWARKYPKYALGVGLGALLGYWLGMDEDDSLFKHMQDKIIGAFASSRNTQGYSSEIVEPEGQGSLVEYVQERVMGGLKKTHVIEPNLVEPSETPKEIELSLASEQPTNVSPDTQKDQNDLVQQIMDGDYLMKYMREKVMGGLKPVRNIGPDWVEPVEKPNLVSVEEPQDWQEEQDDTGLPEDHGINQGVRKLPAHVAGRVLPMLLTDKPSSDARDAETREYWLSQHVSKQVFNAIKRGNVTPKAWYMTLATVALAQLKGMLAGPAQAPFEVYPIRWDLANKGIVGVQPLEAQKPQDGNVVKQNVAIQVGVDGVDKSQQTEDIVLQDRGVQSGEGIKQHEQSTQAGFVKITMADQGVQTEEVSHNHLKDDKTLSIDQVVNDVFQKNNNQKDRNILCTKIGIALAENGYLVEYNSSYMTKAVKAVLKGFVQYKI